MIRKAKETTYWHAALFLLHFERRRTGSSLPVVSSNLKSELIKVSNFVGGLVSTNLSLSLMWRQGVKSITWYFSANPYLYNL